jgi:endonuclease YncB( thermonuclease family)
MEEEKKNKKWDIYHCRELEQGGSFKDLPRFTHAGTLTKAKVVNVYDGDTVTIVFHHGGEFIKHQFRFHGFDAPEMKPSLSAPFRDLHKLAARRVKKYLEDRLLNQIVWIRFFQEEKYGRLMGNVYTVANPDRCTPDDECINDTMIRLKYGAPYDGGKKSTFSKEDLDLIIKT